MLDDDSLHLLLALRANKPMRLDGIECAGPPKIRRVLCLVLRRKAVEPLGSCGRYFGMRRRRVSLASRVGSCVWVLNGSGVVPTLADTIEVTAAGESRVPSIMLGEGGWGRGGYHGL